MSNARNLANLLGTGTQITTADIADGAFQANKNLIINGAMQVAQRGTSQALTSGLFTCDRFKLGWSALDEWVGTMTQVSDSPAGFSNSLKFTTTTPETSIASNEYAYFGQWIEAQNLQHLKFGSASAQSLTVSFWVKSSITGVFGQSIYSADSVRMANATYTINAVNTWEYKTITYTGDTSGAINNDNGEGLRVVWSIAAGTDLNSDPTNNAFEAYTDAKWAGGHVQNGIVTTTNATIQFTGLQLELGDTATPFEHRSYADELLRCQRYYEKSPSGQWWSFSMNANGVASVYSNSNIPFKVEKRATPAITQTSNGNNGTGISSLSTIGITTWGYTALGVAQTTDAYVIDSFIAQSEL